MNDEEYQQLLLELDEIDTLIEEMLDKEEEEKAEKWIAIDKTAMSCVFMNPHGEVRTIGAAYINNLFKKENEDDTETN